MVKEYPVRVESVVFVETLAEREIGDDDGFEGMLMLESGPDSVGERTRNLFDGVWVNILL